MIFLKGHFDFINYPSVIRDYFEMNYIVHLGTLVVSVVKYEQCLAAGYNKSVKNYNRKNKASIKIYSTCMGKSQHFYLEMSFNLFNRLLSWFTTEI